MPAFAPLEGGSRAAAFWLLGAVLGLLLFATSAPSPMYVIC